MGLSDQASQLPWYLSPLSFERSCMDQVSVRIVTRHTKIRSIYIQLPYILNHHCPSSSMSSSSSTSSSPSSHHLHQSISNINFTMISDEKYLVLSIINHQLYKLYSILTIFAPTRDPVFVNPLFEGLDGQETHLSHFLAALAEPMGDQKAPSLCRKTLSWEKN